MGQPKFTEEHLYSGSGAKDLPKGQDIRQDSFMDCYYIAVLGATADRQPDRIKDAISYDAQKGTFTVTLYEEKAGKPEKVQIEVTQAEIEENIKRNGGSTLDNTGKKTPVWPAVMEAAFAKMHDTNHADGLKEGYGAIAGGWSRQAMYALTGENGTDIRIAEAKTIGTDKVFERVRDAIAEGRAVTLSTDPEPGIKQDGLNDDHVYMVERIYKDKSGEVMVELRNPYARNDYVGEGLDTKSPNVTVKLDDVVSTGGFEEFNIGPGKRQPAQHQGGAATGQSATHGAAQGTGDAVLDKVLEKMHDPVALKDALKAAAASADGQQFREQGAAQFEAQPSRTRPEPAIQSPPQPTEQERAPNARAA
jgi:hypothetical protein